MDGIERLRRDRRLRLLGHNLLVYGLGGLIVPFVGIKLIDVLVNLLPVWSGS